ncbi:unnamed protein product [Boreogadus saida]
MRRDSGIQHAMRSLGRLSLQLYHRRRELCREEASGQRHVRRQAPTLKEDGAQHRTVNSQMKRGQQGPASYSTSIGCVNDKPEAGDPDDDGSPAPRIHSISARAVLSSETLERTQTHQMERLFNPD